MDVRVLSLIALVAGCTPPDVADQGLPVGETDDTPLPDSDTDADTVADSDPFVPGPQSGADATWSLGPEVRCADPSARGAAPFRLHEPAGDWSAQEVDRFNDALYAGGGLAVADFTGDGLLDVMVTAIADDFRLWVQGPGLTFRDASDQLPPMPERSTGVTAVDLEGDGDLDAYVAVFKSTDVVLRNDGTGHFEDAGVELGLRLPQTARSTASAWADIDRDGDLDGFVARYGRIDDHGTIPPGDPASLFVRGEDGRYTDLVPGLTAPPETFLVAHPFMAVFVDVELDGWPELYVVNDFGWTVSSQLLANRGGTFEEQVVGVEFADENMGVAVGDLDGDEVYDFFTAGWTAYGLYMSDPSGLWFEASRSARLAPETDLGRHVSWGSEFGDVDNDGDLDLYVAFGHLPVSSGLPNPLDQPDAMYLRDPDGTFRDVAFAWDLAQTGRKRSGLLVDLDRDGFLDLIRTDLRGPTRIDLAACGEGAWLELDVRQPGKNPFGIGTRVRVGTPDRVHIRDVRAGGAGFNGSLPPEVHVGLGDLEVVDFVEIVWPDGERSRMEQVPTRRRLRVERR